MGVKPVMDSSGNLHDVKDVYKDMLANQDNYTQEDGSPISTSQIKYAESFLTPEERDEIYYGDNASKNRGKDALSLDLDGDGKDDIEAGDQQKGGGAAAATVGSAISLGSVATICAGAMSTKLAANINGFVALIAAIAINVGAAMALVFSFANMFDKGYDTRKAFSDANGDNIGTLDSQNDLLVGNMDLMNEDAELYQEQCDEYTEVVTESSNQMAELQIALADARAAGDTNRIQQIQEQIKALKETDFSDQEEGLEETRSNMEVYGASAQEAGGMTENGNTIAEFLDAGNQLGNMAMVNAIMLTVAATVLGICVAFSAIPKIWIGPIPADEPSGLAGSLLFGLASAMMGMAAGKMFKNMSDENEFGDNGGELHNHVDSLNDMICEHGDYMDETTGLFDEMDEESEKEQEENAEEATGAVTDKTGDTTSVRVGGRKDKDGDGIPDDEEDDNNNNNNNNGSGSS